MKLLFDLFPVILFFIAYEVADGRKEAAAQWLDTLFVSAGLAGGFVPDQAPVLLATVVVIVATCAQIAWVWLRHGKVDKMLWVSLGLVVVLGSLTLAFRNDAFIKWKPTLLYWIFAAALLASAALFRKNLVRSMLGAQLTLPEPIWGRLNWVWAGFFVAMGAINLLVAFNYPTTIWVKFKMFGATGLTLAFMVAQGFWLTRYIEEPAPQEPEEKS